MRTETAEVEVSGWEVTEPLLGDRALPGALELGPPASDPLADAAELGAPPALTEPREYMDETDMRLEPRSDSDGAARSAGSGSGECLESSAILPGTILGVSESSTAKSSRLVLLGLIPPCLAESKFAGFRRLYVEEVRDLVANGGGIEKDAGSESVSVMLGSAYRPFLEARDEEWEADRLCEAIVAALSLGIATGRLGLGLDSGLCRRMSAGGGLGRVEVDSTIPLVWCISCPHQLDG